ncbi:PspC domain-containing protein [Cellulomonas sp. McL0617]|uniref:PspC domain-containing protein n=1 Tax=Cellulomonas sp. McL0617 TaxID=3415675 RepID=UPI003CEBE953
MDTSTPPAPPEPGAHPTDGFFAAVRRLGITRADDRWVAGVSAGVADRFGIDPLLVRGIFAASLLLGGLGLIAYGVAWALLPERSDGRIHIEEMLLGRFDVAVLGAFALVLVGFGRGGSWFFFWGPPSWVQGLLWMLFSLGVVAIVLVVVNQHRPRPVAPPFTPPADPQPFDPATLYSPPARPPTDASAEGPTATYAAAAPTAPPVSQPYVSSAYTPPVPPVPPAPPKPPKPPKPPRPRTPGAGVGTVGVVVALSLLTLAGLLVANRTGHFDGPVALTALGVAIVLGGLGIIISGLRGRTSGALGGLAVLGLLAAVPLGIVTSPGSFWQSDGQRQLSATDVTATSRQEAAGGYSMGFGDVTVDLTDVPLTDETLVVPISLAAGDLTVRVPEGASVEADVNIGAGNITWDVGGEHRAQDGVAIDDGNFTTGGGDHPQLRLTIRVGAGQVSIVDASPSAVPPLPTVPTLPTPAG